jgi:hypothetical protein
MSPTARMTRMPCNRLRIRCAIIPKRLRELLTAPAIRSCDQLVLNDTYFSFGWFETSTGMSNPVFIA